jgi:WD40 repeat protein/serine/threonine protein kinase
MNPSDSESDPLLELAEEFADRIRRGERPSLTEYTSRQPQLADRIRSLFPALALMEEFGSVADPPVGPHRGDGDVSPPVLQQLGEYRILREVARGGMGVVYEAVQESLGRHVALKVLPSHDLLSPTHLERFRREARAAARLHHSNIVPVFGVGEDQGVHYYAMQFIHGQGLDTVLRELQRLRPRRALASPRREPRGETSAPEDGRAASLSASLAGAMLAGQFKANAECGMASVVRSKSARPARPPVGREDSAYPTNSPFHDSATRAATLVGQSELTAASESRFFQSVALVGVQVADALAYAHGQGILHRDIKPSNLLLDTQGAIWITDLGLAKLASHEFETGEDALTHTGDIVGTLRYMAPERFEGRADVRSDVFSLGLTLYEMTTLQPAFTASQRPQLIEKVLHEEPPRPRKVDPHVPRDLETIILKAIAKEPEQRYSTAAALAEDLRRFVADRPILARRSSWRERAWRWCRRNPAVASLLGLVIVVFLTGSLFSTYFAFQAEERAQEADKNAKEANQNAEEAKTQTGIAQQNEATAKANELLASRRFHAAQMNLAMQASEAGNPARVLELLEGQRPKFDQEDLRGFEWYYLWRLCQSGKRFTLRGHHVVFSPDGQTLASASGGSGVKLWDVATGKTRGMFLEHGRVVRAAFSLDGKTLATGAFDGTVRLWDVATWHKRASLSQQDAVRGLAFSPNGKILATGGEAGTVRLWYVAKGELRAALRHSTAPVLSVAFSPDGMALASGSGWGKGNAEPGMVTLWDLTAEPVCSRLQLPTNAYSLAFGPDDETLAVGSKEGRVELWNATTGKLRASQQGHRSWVHSVAFAPDGKTLASSSKDRTVKLWDVATWQERATLAHRYPVLHVAFAPDSKTLASGTDDSTIALWDITTKSEPASVLQHTGAVWDIAFTRGGKTLVSVWQHSSTLWDVATGQSRVTLPMSPRPSITSPAGSRPASPFLPPTPAPASRNSSHMRMLAVSPDGITLASSAGNETAVHLWDMATGQEKAPFKGHAKPVHCLRFSPDGRTLASGDEAGTVKLWDLATQQARVTISGPWGSITGLAFSPDGKTMASVRQTESVDIWDAATGQARARFQGDQGGWNWGLSVAFSPDGKILATGNDRGTVKLWDAVTGELRASFKGHTDSVNTVAFFPDGKILATGGEDMTVRLWDVATGQERVTLKGHKGGVAAVAIAPDGNTLASGSADGTVRIWHAATDAEASAPKTELDPDDPGNPKAQNNLADRLLWRGRPREAHEAYRQALSRLEKLLATFPTVPEYCQELARSYTGHSAACSALGQWEKVIADHVRLVQLKPDSAKEKNDLSWLLATCPDAKYRDPGRALEVAKKATELAPKEGVIWNTLGVARYRVGDWKAAIEALTKSNELLGETGLSSNAFFLTMAHWQLGEKEKATKWYERAVQRMEQNRQTLEKDKPKGNELRRFRSEAEALMKKS